MDARFPTDFVERIKTQFADPADFLSASATEPVYSVRLNMRKPADVGLQLSSAVPWCDNAFYLAQRPNYTANPLFHAGCFYPQEASSMFLWRVLSHVRPMLPAEPYVLDLCAAPGGKSTLIASFLDGSGLLVANDPVRSRAWILRENLIKWGYPNVVVTDRQPKDFGERRTLFDLLLIDAPCSGEGMFRKDPQAIDQWSTGNAAKCADRQRAIIADVWDAVAEGGVVVYSTCTFNPDENERNMEWLANQYDVEFIKVDVEAESGITPVPFAGGEGYGFYPHKVRGEGFFICAMRKLGGRKRRDAIKRKKLPRVPDMQSFVGSADMIVTKRDADIIALPSAIADTMVGLAEELSPMWYGVQLGTKSRNVFVPSEELPFFICLNNNSFPHIDLSERQALDYLRGQMGIGAPASANGWNVVRYGGVNLGFVKSAGNRMNNYYPKEWRIKMNI